MTVLIDPTDRADIERRLREWFEEARPGPAPERLRQLVEAMQPASRQRPRPRSATVPHRVRPWTPSRLVAITALLALTLLLAVWAAVGQQPSPLLPFAPGSIAFARGGDLYVASPDGSDPKLVARADAAANQGIYDVDVAPGGRAIAFLEEGDTTQIVVTVSADGARLGSFSPVTDMALPYDWAPDGQNIAYMSGGEWVQHAIVIVGLDGRPEATLSLPDGFGRNTSGGDTGPLWSPDGRWLAVAGCQSPCDTKYETHILLVAADGAGYHWLTDDRALQDYSMAWSADSRLAIGRFGGDRRVDVMSTGGSLLREVTLPHDAGPERLAWSPDGTELAVEASGLVIIPADDAPATVSINMMIQPTQGPGLAGWSQDGRELLFTTWTDDGPTTLWAIDSTGGTPRQLIDVVDWPGPLDTLGPPP